MTRLACWLFIGLTSVLLLPRHVRAQGTPSPTPDELAANLAEQAATRAEEYSRLAQEAAREARASAQAARKKADKQNVPGESPPPQPLAGQMPQPISALSSERYEQLKYTLPDLSSAASQSELQQHGLDMKNEAAFRQMVPYAVRLSNAKAVGGNTSAQLTASKDGGNATIKFASKNDNQAAGIQSNIILSSPLSKNSDQATKLATLDGLADAATIALTYARIKPFGDSLLSDTSSPRSMLYGVTGKIGYQQFSFYDSSNLSKKMDQKGPTSASLFFGSTIDRELRAMLVAKFSYQNSYKDNKTGTLCPLPTTAPTKCISGPLGDPVHSIARIFSLEGRYVAPTFDLDPVLSYDSVSGVKGLDVPIYFIGAGSSDSNKPVPFNAGVDLGWRTDTHGSISIFFGAPFSFWDIR